MLLCLSLFFFHSSKLWGTVNLTYKVCAAWQRQTLLTCWWTECLAAERGERDRAWRGQDFKVAARLNEVHAKEDIRLRYVFKNMKCSSAPFLQIQKLDLKQKCLHCCKLESVPCLGQSLGPLTEEHEGPSLKSWAESGFPHWQQMSLSQRELRRQRALQSLPKRRASTACLNHPLCSFKGVFVMLLNNGWGADSERRRDSPLATGPCCSTSFLWCLLLFWSFLNSLNHDSTLWYETGLIDLKRKFWALPQTTAVNMFL